MQPQTNEEHYTTTKNMKRIMQLQTNEAHVAPTIK
jgi:hypothetical protein